MSKKALPENNNDSIWKVYILRCADGSLYTGITNNLAARLDKHNKGTGAKYTRSRRPVSLVYSEDVDDKSQALKREHSLKQLKRGEKEKLLSMPQTMKRS
jgi:predicted GIY-YIG superfamily endonuclease